jgi:acetyl-CoA/propionyl-CoA carboxylase biotin carboxyl carrier protein
MTEFLRPSQAAERLGATTRSVQRWIATGLLPAERVGGRWRVASDALESFAAQRSPGEVRRLEVVFVANRGEIAQRVTRTAERLGIRAVVPETAGAAALDLLDIDAVVHAATAARADALHPGYGFLAENADFAAAIEAAGITWIGPPPDAIRAMGDKATARRLAVGLGVPVLPGYDEADQSDEALIRAAGRIGLPVLVKPSAGGGGKGMRVVRDLERLPDALAAARREAQAAFGDERVILERYLEGPRHVEIQVLFDAFGSGVQLGERDCSIQRRHQKVLEESPSPAVDAALRTQMGEAAVRLAGAVGYRSAGTCEFLVDDRGGFYFLEMNTRLQVEHPVTELITGRDLVADQLRIASGQRLGFTEGEIQPDGHAIEARLYAEDAEAGFLPATGRVVAVRWPRGEGIRVDAGIVAGSEVGSRFDPLLAKIIVHGPDRAAAFARMAEALDRTVVLGLVTNLRFLRWLVREPAVLDGQARIDTLERIWPPDDWTSRTVIPEDAWAAAARHLGSDAGADGGADPWRGGWRLNALPTAYLAADGLVRPVRFGPAGAMDEAEVAIDGSIVHIDVGGRSVAFQIAPPPDVDRAARAAASHAGGGAADVEAPMPGAVLAVHVAPGASVAPGDPVVTLEAMKMEHVVPASAPGTIAEILVRPADQVTRGQVLARIEP